MDLILGKIHFVLLAYFAWGFYTQFLVHQDQLEELSGKIPRIHSQIKKAKKNKKDLENYFQDIEEAKTRIEKVAKEIEELQKTLPAEISDTDNLGLLSGLAEQLNIKNVFLTPGEETDLGFYYTKIYNFKATGTFLQFLIFLEKISENPRLLNINSVKFGQSNERQRGRFQLITGDVSIEVYRYNSAFRESRGIEEIVEQFKKPVSKKKKKKKNRRKKK